MSIFNNRIKTDPQDARVPVISRREGLVEDARDLGRT